MGACRSKPRPSRHTADSMVFCDGFAPLADPRHTSTNDGRFLFILGDERVVWVSFDYEDDDDEFMTTFSLDVIDLLTLRRKRIMSIGEFYNIGRTIELYALDARTVVLIDICEKSLPGTLYQRVIRIDWNRAEAECVFYRGHSVAMNFEIDHGFLFVDKEWAAIVCTGYTDQVGFIMPVDPLSTNTVRDISHLFEQASQWLPVMYRPNTDIEWGAPLFYSENEMGCFIILDVDGEPIRDNECLIVIDTITGSMRVDKFPPGVFDSQPKAIIDYTIYSDGGREVALMSNFKRVGGWQAIPASALRRLTLIGQHAADRTWMPTRLARYLDEVVVNRLEHVQNRLIYPQREPFLRFGILDVKTMEWTRVEASVNMTDITWLYPPNGAYFAINSMTNKAGTSRAIGSEVMESMDKIDIIRHALRLPSLTRLSTLAVQRSGRVSQEQLEQIASRMG